MLVQPIILIPNGSTVSLCYLQWIENRTKKSVKLFNKPHQDTSVYKKVSQSVKGITAWCYELRFSLYYVMIFLYPQVKSVIISIDFKRLKSESGGCSIP